jgi:hypothetical protein
MTAQITSGSVANPSPKPQRKSAGAQIIALVFGGMLFGAGSGFAIGRLLKHDLAGFHPHAWSLAFVALAMFLTLALHEAGHVALGLANGMRFRIYVVGPLRIEREDGKLTVSFNRLPALWGGLAGCVPKDYKADLRSPMLWFTFGGPLFSLLGILVLRPGVALLKSSSDLAAGLVMLGITSGAVAVVTLIPMRVAGFTSDGARLLALLRNREEGRRWTAMAAVAGLSIVERPRNWPAELVELLGDAQDGSSDAVSVCLLRYLWHADRSESSFAAVWLERALDNIQAYPEAMRPAVYCAAASHYARHSDDAAKARQYMDLAEGPGLQNRKALHSIRAAVLIAEGRTAEAVKELDQAEADLTGKPSSLAEAAREDLAELRESLARMESSPQPVPGEELAVGFAITPMG